MCTPRYQYAALIDMANALDRDNPTLNLLNWKDCAIGWDYARLKAMGQELPWNIEKGDFCFILHNSSKAAAYYELNIHQFTTLFSNIGSIPLTMNVDAVPGTVIADRIRNYLAFELEYS